MAILQSEEQGTKSRLQMSAGQTVNHEEKAGAGQLWQRIILHLQSGSRNLETQADQDYLLCRKPQDEIEDLCDGLKQVVDGSRQSFFFEPSEPSFELSLERRHSGGIEVEVWLDAGNGESGIYTFDAIGIRFYTTTAAVDEFVRQLKAEFGK
jgi:hypothetical protein